MKKKYYIAITMAAVLILSASCSDEDNPATAVSPIFSVTPVDISGPYLAADSTYGDIKFVLPVIVPFGSSLSGDRLSPAIEYYTVPGAEVRAITAGVVTAILANPVEEGDYEIQITSLPGSDYLVIYDHVLNVQVQESLPVDPGEILGEAGTWNETMRRTSLQVNIGQNADERSYCPLNYGDSVFVEQHRRLLQEYNSRILIPKYDSLCLSGPVGP